MKIQIVKCTAHGKPFENLTPGSIHEVITSPIGIETERGWWVMGVGEPVLVLYYEARVYDEAKGGQARAV